MRKLVIQIPCFNEARTLGVTLSELPRHLEGVERVEWLVVDDGSTDGTAEVARRAGADYVVVMPRHRGLASAFMCGVEASLAAGADVIVNTDADNQYRAEDIPALVRPILEGEAEIVVGARPISEIRHFSWIKKLLQRFGSAVIRVVSDTGVQDAPSGFRAMSRDAAMRLHVFNDFTYTLETVIQAGRKGMAIASVPVRTNEPLRSSRLFRNLAGYVRRQLLTSLRIFMTYRPFVFFAVPGVVAFGAGLVISLRFVYFYLTVGGRGHVQSLILAALLLGTGFFLSVVGLLADLVSVNRQLLEDLDYRLKRIEDGGRSRERTRE